ncbi:hypothetical protein D3C80_1242640 [compost metagenome]
MDIVGYEQASLNVATIAIKYDQFSIRCSAEGSTKIQSRPRSHEAIHPNYIWLSIIDRKGAEVSFGRRRDSSGNYIES